MSDVNQQVVISRDPGNPLGTGDIQDELKNQQLNTALAAGTVDTILMKTGYVAIYDYNVVVKKDVKDFCTPTCVQDLIDSFNGYDFGAYEYLAKRLYIKSNKDYATSSDTPDTIELWNREIAIDNNDGSLYLRGSQGTAVQKVDAGTVNGNQILGTWNPDLYYTKTDIKIILNGMFEYQPPGTLYIKDVL